MDSDDDFIGFDSTDQINYLSQQLLTQLNKSLKLIDELNTSPVISPVNLLPQITVTQSCSNNTFSPNLNELFISPSPNFSSVPNSVSSPFTPFTSSFTAVDLNLNFYSNISPISPLQPSIISYTPLTITNQMNTPNILPVRRCFRRLSSENIIFNLEDSQNDTIDNNLPTLSSPSLIPSLDDTFLQEHPIHLTESSPVSLVTDTDINVIQEFLQSFDEQGKCTHSTPTPVISKPKKVRWSPSIEIEGVTIPISVSDNTDQISISNITDQIVIPDTIDQLTPLKGDTNKESIAQRTRKKKSNILPDLPWVQDTVLEWKRPSKIPIFKVERSPVPIHLSPDTTTTVTITTIQSSFTEK
ncbi:UNVERIFIED_CONTAM: hypothetical protein RMT77_006886 [Armadillidium vulgare]